MQLTYEVDTDIIPGTAVWTAEFQQFHFQLNVDEANQHVAWYVQELQLMGISTNVFDAQAAAIIAVKEFWATLSDNS